MSLREARVLDLPTAVHKMTGLPARKFHLPDRGELRPGAFADMIVFDPARIEDVGTYADPCRRPRGIRKAIGSPTPDSARPAVV